MRNSCVCADARSRIQYVYNLPPGNLFSALFYAHLYACLMKVFSLGTHTVATSLTLGWTAKIARARRVAENCERPIPMAPSRKCCNLRNKALHWAIKSLVGGGGGADLFLYFGIWGEENHFLPKTQEFKTPLKLENAWLDTYLLYKVFLFDNDRGQPIHPRAVNWTGRNRISE